MFVKGNKKNTSMEKEELKNDENIDKPLKGFKSLTEKDLINSFNFQYKNVGWDFYAERQFIEELFSQRFNYLIAIFSLFIAAAASVKTQTNLIIVLSLGTVLTTLISITIYRAYIKLIILLKILYKLGDNHVFKVVDKEIKAMGKKALFGVNHIIGVYIPIFCSIILLAGLILAIFEVIIPIETK
jgi:hypothetical protein